MSHGNTLDRIYRYQRYFYDATRPLFLPGRNGLLDALQPKSGEKILEMGCGTARNLIRLARRFDGVLFFGVDASQQMLDTAFRNIRRAGLEERIRLKYESAEDVDPTQTFGLDSKFDKIFFSYSLSMMPTWEAALSAAKRAMHPEGRVFVVDFWNQHGWPRPLRAVLRAWLSLFHVRYPEGMAEELRRLFPETAMKSLIGGYAFLAGPKETIG